MFQVQKSPEESSSSSSSSEKETTESEAKAFRRQRGSRALSRGRYPVARRFVRGRGRFDVGRNRGGGRFRALGRHAATRTEAEEGEEEATELGDMEQDGGNDGPQQLFISLMMTANNSYIMHGNSTYNAWYSTLY